MDFEQILYEKNGPVLTITLNRPDKLNAYTALMQAEIISALDAADADDDVRAIIFTGAGRGFCAGADLSSGGNTFNNDAPGREGGLKRDGGGVLTLRIFESLKPIISACNGPAVGVGATMQCAMDVRLASENARYGFVFSKRAVVPEACSSWFLPKIVGIQQALEWTFSVGCSMPRRHCRVGSYGAFTSLQIYCPQPLILLTSLPSQRHRYRSR